ncbi:MAG: hypothetical protein ACTHKG_12045 [Nocardioides sp.]
MTFGGGVSQCSSSANARFGVTVESAVRADPQETNEAKWAEEERIEAREVSRDKRDELILWISGSLLAAFPALAVAAGALLVARG